jgi:hypothetical protein
MRLIKALQCWWEGHQWEPSTTHHMRPVKGSVCQRCGARWVK